MPSYRFSFAVLIAVTTFSVSTFAAINRVGGKPKQSIDQKMIANIRDAVDGLRDTLADQSVAIQGKMEPILREVNAQAERYISTISEYAEARDNYYANFDNTRGDSQENNKDARKEMDSKRRTMDAERNQYYEDTSRYLRTLHQARRAARRNP